MNAVDKGQTLVAGRYEVMDELGSGAEGVVLRVYDHASGRTLALKRAHAHVARAEAVADLKRQFVRLAEVRHPHVARVFEFGYDDAGRPFFTMEVLEGGPLTPCPDDLARAIVVGAQIASALDAIHARGNIHGDLKPENAFAVDGPRPRTVLADLGLARPFGKTEVTGTPDYMAPEVVGGEPADGRADFYSLGIALYEMICGARPFPGTTPLEVMRQHREGTPALIQHPHAPPVLVELVARLLEKDPDARVRDGQQVLDSLRLAAETLGITGALDPHGVLDGLLIGREQDLRRLRRIWALTRRQRRIRTCLVTGSAGVGKSRLVDELTWRAQSVGSWVGQARCDADETRSYASLRRAIAPIVCRLDGPTRKRLQQDFPVAAPALFDSRRQSTPEPAPLQAYELLMALFAACPRPALVVVDQLEDASTSVKGVIQIASRHGGPGRGMLLGVWRTSREEPALPLGFPEGSTDHCAVVQVGPLDSTAIELLAKRTLGARRLSDSFRALLADESQGNPGRVIRLLRDLMADGTLTRRQGSWTAEVSGLRFDASGLNLDDGTHAEARAALAGPFRALALALAVVRSGTQTLLAEIVDPDEIEAGLHWLESMGYALAASPDGRYCVRSRELAENTEALARPDHLGAIRARAARALARQAPTHRDEQAQVARLAIAAGETDLACVWTERCLDELLNSGSADSARDLLECLLEGQRSHSPEASARTLQRLIEVTDALGDHEGVLRRSTELLSVAEALVGTEQRDFHRILAWRWRADAFEELRMSEAATEAAREGLLLLGEDDTVGANESGERANERAHLLHIQALCARRGNQWDAASAILEGPALAAAAQSLDPSDQTARIKSTLADLARLRGDYEAAAAYNAEALAYFESAGDLQRMAGAYNLFGILAFARGRWDTMASNFNKVLHCSERMGDPTRMLVGLGNVAFAYSEAGKWDEAMEAIGRGLLLCERLGDEQSVVNFLVNGSIIQLGRGDVAEAEAGLQRALATDVDDTPTPARAVIVGNLGDCHSARGAYDLAARAYEQALALAAELGMADEVIENRRRLAETHLYLGDTTRAWREGRAALALAHQNGNQVERAHIYRIIGRHHELEHRHRPAKSAYERALKVFRALDRTMEVARVQHRLGVVIARAGDLSVGLHQLGEAERVFRVRNARGALALVEEDRRALRPDNSSSSKAFRKMEILLSACQGINAATDAEELLGTVIDGVVEVSEAERGFMVDLGSEGEFTFSVVRRRSPDAVAPSEGDISMSALRRAFEDGEASVIANTGNSVDTTRSMKALELKSVMCVPLVVKGSVVGAIYVDNRCLPTEQFGDEDLKVLESLASIAATSLERSRLYSRLLENYHSLESSKEVLARALRRLKAAKEGLIEQERMSALGQLASGLAHELKQPLTAIIGSVGLLELEIVEPKAQERLALIQRQALRMRKLVHSMNHYGAPTNQEVEAVDPAAALEEALALLGDRIRRADVDLDTDFQPNRGLVLGDPNRLQQVMINLLANALDALDGRDLRRLRIRSKVDEATYTIEISDSGCGIAPERIGRIFDLFETSKARGQGTGMGLSITRSIVGEYGGELNVESEVGVGTVFCLSLPRHETLDASAAE